MKITLGCTILTLLSVLPFAQSQSEFTINAKQGNIIGVRKEARNGDKFYAFYGIPYAKPPVGDLRFKKPASAPFWEGDRPGREPANECWQNPPDNAAVVTGDEDCLFVNVFTKYPTENDSGLKPVLVWIHGGAFIFGGAKLYDPRYLMEEDIVVVVVQYRLNIFGFLSFEDEDSPGNYGMWDQIEALKWVQMHIDDYGGDPTQVTLFGMSAGGASVHYQMLSPHSVGLFQRAISFSGSALNWWAHIQDPKEQAVLVASEVGCPFNENVDATMNCLRNVPADKLFNAQYASFNWHPNGVEREPMNSFSPRADPEVPGERGFLPWHPLVAMKMGEIHDVPYMLGYAEKEGGWRANYIFPDDVEGALWKEFAEKFVDLAPLAFGLARQQSENANEIVDKMRDFYGMKKLFPISDETAEAYVDAQSDTMFNYGIDITAKLHAKHGKAATYLYYLRYPGEHTLTNFRTDHSIKQSPVEVLRKATHGTDMLLMWDMFPFEPMPKIDIEVSRKFIKAIVHFAKEGKPSYAGWKGLSSDKVTYFDMNERFTVKQGWPPIQDRMKFWQEQKAYWNYTLAEINPNKDEL